MSKNQKLTSLVGCFTRCDKVLALPIHNLQEVVPLEHIHPVPDCACNVQGSINLRGQGISILDLRNTNKLTPLKPENYANHCVVIVQHNQRLIGLLADNLLGLFEIQDDEVTLCEHEGLIGQQVEIRQENKLATMLQLDRLMNLPGVAYSQVKVTGKLNTISTESNSEKALFLLMRTAGLDLAIAPEEVETTLASPEVITQDLSGGYFTGVIDYRGITIPAIELSRLIGIGCQHNITDYRAIVLRTAAGAVAILIEEILEIVEVNASRCLKLPRLPNHQGKSIKGILPNELLGFKLLDKLKPLTQQHLILNSDEIKQHDGILELCATYIGKEASDPSDQQPSKLDNLQSAQSKPCKPPRLITYYLNELQASPIDQIVEVLPFDSSIQFLDPSLNQSLMGLISNRGRTLPVFDLGLLKYGKSARYTQESAILVVHHHQEPIGLAVERLHSIEHASWLVEVPLISAQERPCYQIDRLLHKRAEFKLNNQTVMVDVIDLHEAIDWAYQTPVAVEETRSEDDEQAVFEAQEESALELTGIPQPSGNTVNA